MKEPIFVYEPVDLTVFDSKDAAERYLEPVDVENEDYTYFDSEGRVLTANVIIEPSGRKRVVIQETTEYASETLRQVLIEFLANVGNPREVISNDDLATLAELSRAYSSE